MDLVPHSLISFTYTVSRAEEQEGKAYSKRRTQRHVTLECSLTHSFTHYSLSQCDIYPRYSLFCETALTVMMWQHTEYGYGVDIIYQSSHEAGLSGFLIILLIMTQTAHSWFDFMNGHVSYKLQIFFLSTNVCLVYTNPYIYPFSVDHHLG